MANPESFVSPRRGGGTGAAAILQPSTALKDIFTTYDAQRKQSPDAYYDSLGNDIKQDFDIGKGITNAADKLAIKSQLDKMINQQANIYYSRKNFAQAPDEYKKYYEERQRTTDLSSKALRDEATYNAIAKEVAAKDYKYDKEKSLENINKWREIPLEQRPPRPELVFIDQSNYNKMFKDFGNKSHIVEDVNGSYVDGTGATVRRVSFSEPNARKDWQITVANNPNTAPVQKIFAMAADKAEEAAQMHGIDWATLPMDVKNKAIADEAEDSYVEAMRSSMQTKKSITSTINTTEPKQGAKPQDVAKRFTIETLVTPSGNARGVKKQAVLNLVGILGNDKDSAVQSWIGETNNGTTENIVGRAQRIIQEEGKPAYVEISVSDTDGSTSFKYAPYFKNKDKVVTDYGVDFEKDRPKDWSTRWANAKASYPLQKKEESPEVYQQRLKLFKPVVDEYNSKKASVVKSSESTPNKWSSYKRK